MSSPRIIPADFRDEQLLALLTLHQRAMRDSAPPGFSFALDLSGLQHPSVKLWAAWEGEDLLACGALKELDPRWGEVKCMRTDPRFLRRGAGRAILCFLIAEATRRGYQRLSLETGTSELFAPAIALYTRHGFTPGEPFADYAPSPHNQFFHLSLRGTTAGHSTG